MDQTALNDINQCKHTGLEKPIKGCLYSFDNYRLLAWCDNFKQKRLVLKCKGEIVSVVMLDCDGIIRWRYTRPDHRGNNYTNTIKAMAGHLWGIDCIRSEYLTEAGKACYKPRKGA